MTNIELFKEELLKRDSFQKELLNKAFKNMDDDLKNVLNRYLIFNMSRGNSIENVVDDYYFMISETNKQQLFFLRSGVYQNKTYEDIAKEAYDNSNYMERYMIGLAVSTFLWEQHRDLYCFFCDFMKCYKSSFSLPYKGKYLEVGAGHGLYAVKAVETGVFSQCDFIDVSKQGLKMTEEMLEDVSDLATLTFMECDFNKYESNELYDVISASEVIEAVENPYEFLRKCHKIIKPTGKVHISTPINSPMVDCIYLFRNVNEVENIIYSAGFEIIKKKYIPHKENSMEECEKNKLPINVAYILQKG